MDEPQYPSTAYAWKTKNPSQDMSLVMAQPQSELTFNAIFSTMVSHVLLPDQVTPRIQFLAESDLIQPKPLSAPAPVPAQPSSILETTQLPFIAIMGVVSLVSILALIGTIAYWHRTNNLSLKVNFPLIGGGLDFNSRPPSEPDDDDDDKTS